jgi:YD repeat-containing protein
VLSSLTAITYPGGTTTTFTYDSRGRRTSVTDQNGRTTTYAYDDANRLTSVTDAAGHATSYAYDTENNLTGITDANNHTTFFSYDAFGRVTQTNFPSTLSETQAAVYPGRGRVASPAGLRRTITAGRIAGSRIARLARPSWPSQPL